VSGASQSERLYDLARQFRQFLIDQTNVELVDLGAAASNGGPEALRSALDRLDAALSQLADLGSVYAETSSSSLEPVVYPVTALAGEYIRATIGGEWQAADDTFPGDDTLIISLADDEFLDLLAVVRAALLSGPPRLAAMVRS
jgi:hypothetical protein